MAKTTIATQIDDVLGTVQKWLGKGRKKSFQFYVQALQPFMGDVVSNVKDILTNSSPEKHSLVQNFSKTRFLIWLGIASAIMGILILISPKLFISWQMILIPLIAIVGPWLMDFFRESSQEAKETIESYDGRELIGKAFVLKNDIVGGVLEMTIQGETWEIKGEDLSRGSRVRVVAVSEKTLFITSVE